MSWIHPRVWLSALLALVFVLSGCSKDDGSADANKPFTLPGASKVLEALDKKDYENTVSGLAEIKGAVTPKTQDEFRRLRQKVLDKLVDEMGESEPAKEAYRAIGMLENGR